MTSKLASKGFATRAVHAGERVRRDAFVPMSTPIYSSATFLYDTLEEAVAALEGGDTAVSFSSGMAAILLGLLAAGVEQGSTVAASQDLYGVTMKLLTDVAARWGVQVEFVDVFDLAGLEQRWAEQPPRALLLESLSNPLLRVPDLPALIAAARPRRTRVIVDNTFATPMLLQPLRLGADFVVHSATKYLGGHGDLIGGVLVAREEFTEELHHLARLIGAVLGPFEAWLTLRGLKTLPLRLARQCESARALAEWLSRHPRVERVYYPALASHPDHERSQRLFTYGWVGGVVSFAIRGARQAEVFRFVNSLELFLKATTMGDLQSLVLYPRSEERRVGKECRL